MTSLRRRRYVLAGVLAVIAAATTVLLWDVLTTVFFAITVAYVVLPFQKMLTARGLDRRVASGVVTVATFLAAVALVTPLLLALYLRRTELLARLSALPDSVVVTVSGVSTTVDVRAGLDALRDVLADLAVVIATESPVLALKAALFAFVLYALLLDPRAPRGAIFGVTPPAYHDVLERLNDRVRITLNALYLLQAATAVGTFLVSIVVFLLLGYKLAIAYAVIAGILQFIPIVGPSLLVLALAGYDLVFGDPTRAVLVVVIGLPVIGFIPDAVIRPRLAKRTAKLPGSVYFVGFTGGVLSIGAVGFIAGPLVVALLVEAVDLLSD